MSQNSDHETIQQEFQALRGSLNTVQLATIDADGKPESSYAPYVWIEKAAYLYLSELARHTTNLKIKPLQEEQLYAEFVKSSSETPGW